MDHAALAVRDVDRSIRFYSEALGLRLLRISVLRPTPGTAVKNAYMYSGTFLLELVTAESSAVQREPPRTWQEGMRQSIGITHLGMRVRNLETAVQKLKAAGAVMLGEPFEVAKETTSLVYLADKVDSKIRYVRKPGKKPWRIAVFLDPDGIMVELIER